ncbi:amino acid permease [Clostridium sp. SHJSY1]|uniref:amino acid permease n=1 Tax=Clostridium sp. SHJSY1 TaxID=2942483 RepID=UPI002874F754|nr:amino acid permease [Clostridium sp. SHJSY1]MDS0525546.1 amino acid permease [Clostridium sp. SHJSY1]
MNNNKNNLKRELGLLAATAIVVGNMVGSGIFTAPQTLASVSNPFTTILAWVITGVGSLLLALTFAKLGTRYPSTGGPIVYTNKAFGEFMAFLVAWTFWIGSWVGNAAIITAIIKYLTPFFPILSTSGAVSFIVSSAFLWILTFINCKGVKEASIVGIITTTLKLGAILVFVVIAIYGFNPDYLSTYSSPDVQGINTLPGAIAVTLWSFIGLESASLSGGEIKNPEVNIKRSTIIGTILATIIYLLLSFLAMGGLSQTDLASSDAPLSAIINHITGQSWGGSFISIGIAISAAGTASGWILTTGRAAYAAGEDGLFPKIFANVHPKFKTPVASLVISSICTNLLLILNYSSSLSEAFNFMINLATLSFIPAYALSTCAEIILTYKSGTKLTFLRFMKHGFFPLLAFSYSLYIIYGSGSNSAMWMFILMLLGVPFYTYKKLQHKNQ